jgi:hypothetical protein
LGDEVAIGDAALAGRIDDDAGLGDQARGRDAPALGGGLDQQGATHGPNLAAGLPLVRRRGRAASRLIAIGLGIDRGLLDADLGPIDVQFLGDQHWQRGLDPLPDLRPLGGDSDDPVRRDAHERVQRRGRGRARRPDRARQLERQQEPAANGRAGLQEETARRLVEQVGHAHASTRPAATLIAFLMRM